MSLSHFGAQLAGTMLLPWPDWLDAGHLSLRSPGTTCQVVGLLISQHHSKALPEIRVSPLWVIYLLWVAQPGEVLSLWGQW